MAEIMDGKKLFEERCSKCHGKDGTVNNHGKKLKPFPARNLTAIAEYVPADEIRRIVTYGIHGTDMKPKNFEGGPIDPLEREAIVDYVKGTFRYYPNLGNGRRVFKKVCAQCHGEDGRANTGLGAKNLVYSKLDLPDIVHTVRYGRAGTLMSGKRRQLSNVAIADVANYVYALRRMGDARRGMRLYDTTCQECHATPSDIRLTGHAARPHIAINELDDHMLDLRIRHGRHIDRAGKVIKKLSDDNLQDVIAYIRQETN
ncbi:MAG: c-type cytochrome [Mariprofundaceae bacterium]